LIQFHIYTLLSTYYDQLKLKYEIWLIYIFKFKKQFISPENKKIYLSCSSGGAFSSSGKSGGLADGDGAGSGGCGKRDPKAAPVSNFLSLASVTAVDNKRKAPKQRSISLANTISTTKAIFDLIF